MMDFFAPALDAGFGAVFGAPLSRGHRHTGSHALTYIALHRFTTFIGPELTRTLFRVVKLLLPAADRNLLAP